MPRIILLIVAVLIFSVGTCFAGQWLWHHNEEIKGQVIEADTHKPIEGALIIALWNLEDVVNEGPGGYDRVEVVESDKSGNFVITSWFSFKPWQILYKINNGSPYIFIFKPGFKIFQTDRPAMEGFPGDTSISEAGKRILKERYGLKPAKLKKIRTDNERLESISILKEARFPGQHFSVKQLLKIFDKYEEEINSLSETTKEKNGLKRNLYKLKSFYVGGGYD